MTEEINKFGVWENYYQYLLTTYGETKPWEALGISRSWYYKQKRLGVI